MAEKSSRPKGGRRKKRSLASGQIHVHATFNNTIITVTDHQGNTVCWSSPGAVGLRGSRRSTAFAARLAAEDVKAILAHRNDPPVVVIAPDRKKQGTNALFVCPPGLIDFMYGEGSFDKRCQGALDAGVRLEICNLPSLELDLDEPEDFALMEAELGLEEQ